MIFASKLVLLASLVIILSFLGQTWQQRSQQALRYEDEDVNGKAILKIQEEAKRLRSQLTLDEKISLLHGTGNTFPYIGNVPGLPQIGIPSINMNDGPQGFRTKNIVPGTSTAWPCALSMAATWDEELVHQWGVVMAKEFRDKGANVLLGPGVNVARIPSDGRNFEYISGEDPTLGAKLVAAEIRGIQKVDGMMACVKHFVENNQEVNRTTVNAVVDERTHWELYMPPFEAAVEAGVLSVMCSYNRVNGDYACENNATLNGDLKGTLGFQGFVVSDWHATHSTIKAAMSGLDMEMPGSEYFGDPLKEAVANGSVACRTVDDMVDRILYALIASGAIDHPSHGSLDQNVTSVKNNQLARKFATQGIVLLKNEDNILPLSSENCDIVVIGDTIATGRGSGLVEGPYVISGLEGIQNKCQGAASTVKFESMKHPNMTVVREADVVVVFTSTTSWEGADRKSLSFPTREVKVIDEVIEVADKVIVVGTTPGAIMLSFAQNVSGLLLTFMPGQEAGNAIADILFGDVNPSGRLPVTIPNVENEMQFSPQQYPGTSNTSIYSEKLFTGYRWYDAKGVQPKFEFGFGLSYSDFVYSDIAIIGRTVQFKLTNSGQRDAAEVAQLYLSYPEGTGEPPKVLKNFQKVFLTSGSSTMIWFHLQKRDFSVWNAEQHDWEEVDGVFHVSVGSSSRNVPLHATINYEKDTDMSMS